MHVRDGFWWTADVLHVLYVPDCSLRRNGVHSVYHREVAGQHTGSDWVWFKGLLIVVHREISSVSWWFTPPWNQKRRGTGNWEGAWKSVLINWDTPSTYRPGLPDSTAWFIIDQVGVLACCHGYVFMSLCRAQSPQMSSDGAWYRETKLSSDAAADEESASSPWLAPTRESAASHRTCGAAATLH